MRLPLPAAAVVAFSFALWFAGCSQQGRQAKPLPGGDKTAKHADPSPAAKQGETADANVEKPANDIHPRTEPTADPLEKSEAEAARQAAAEQKKQTEKQAAPPAGDGAPAEPTDGDSLAWLDGPPRIAPVMLTDQEAKLCKVKVGDELPNLMLADRNGATQELHSLLGKRGTVVCFWSGNRLAALEELADLGPEVAVPFGPLGIAVVGIAVNETPDSAKKVLDGDLQGAKPNFPNLIDADGAGFAQVGEALLPRTFLLDASGKILWFDLEYSRTTRRELKLAINYLLNSRQAAKP